MSAVILVRHALPEISQGTSSKLWGLSESAREDCVLLAHALPATVTAVWSSEERKAKETADVLGLRLGLPVQVDARFGEVDRPAVWDRDYREVAAGYLGGVDEPGWEARDAVLARFSAALDEARRASAGDIVVANHGMALSLWIASVAPIDLVAFWQALTFPDAWRVDVEAGTAERIWMGGRVG